MNPNFLSYCQTQIKENEENNQNPYNFNTIINSFNFVFQYSLDAYRKFSEIRLKCKKFGYKIVVDSEIVRIRSQKRNFRIYMKHLMIIWKMINIQIRLCVIPKIRHQIFESDVDWYTENITKDLEYRKKNNNYPSFLKPVLERHPKEAQHTALPLAMHQNNQKLLLQRSPKGLNFTPKAYQLYQLFLMEVDVKRSYKISFVFVETQKVMDQGQDAVPIVTRQENSIEFAYLLINSKEPLF
ncbi:unnamed protein product [Paramecium octaurelia]|uniref:Uncharacterized protein n=1 Tax=Paramecium octaurelia TaxID=43137 RepID=A0A8S1XTZ3_PAROT|nr:unnamed protein product [Paramecium octaurelia]